MVQNIQTSAEDMIRFAKIASTSSATQDFLVSDAPLSRLEYSRAVSNSIFSITQDNLNMAILIMEDDGVTPVSYTHLDVYKRQPPSHLDTKERDC